ARDLRGVRFHGEGIGQRHRVVEIPPWIEVDDLVVAHAANPQHRSAWAQNRHSKKSRLAAMRGSSSPASVACRIRTARSDMRCARSASKATCSWCSSAVSLLIAVKIAGEVEIPGTEGSM